VLSVRAWFAVGSRHAPRTMRVDYLHAGDASEEHFSVEQVVVEPREWPGHPSRAIDETNLGKYFFEVVEPSSHRVLYSRGFASIYGEWETTGEAKQQKKTFSESFRFPTPAGPIQIILKKRDPKNVFQVLWTIAVDPKDASP